MPHIAWKSSTWNTQGTGGNRIGFGICVCNSDLKKEGPRRCRGKETLQLAVPVGCRVEECSGPWGRRLGAGGLLEAGRGKFHRVWGAEAGPTRNGPSRDRRRRRWARPPPWTLASSPLSFRFLAAFGSMLVAATFTIAVAKVKYRRPGKPT
jgi:hypothetical protein